MSQIQIPAAPLVAVPTLPARPGWKCYLDRQRVGLDTVARRVRFVDRISEQ
jgi:hypothetical protein